MYFLARNAEAVCSWKDWMKIIKTYPEFCFEATQSIVKFLSMNPFVHIFLKTNAIKNIYVMSCLSIVEVSLMFRTCGDFPFKMWCLNVANTEGSYKNGCSYLIYSVVETWDSCRDSNDIVTLRVNAFDWRAVSRIANIFPLQFTIT